MKIVRKKIGGFILTTISTGRLRLLTADFVLISFMLGCNEFMIVGNLSLIANSFHESLAQIAWLVSAFAWTYALLTPLITMATARFDRFKLLLTLLGVFLVGTVISCWAPSFNWLLLARILTASVAGLLESLLLVIAYDLAPNQASGSQIVAWIYTGFGIASVAGVPLGTFIAAHWHWQAAFYLVTAVTAVVAVATVFLVPHHLPGTPGSIKAQLKLFGDRQIWLGIGFVTFGAATLYGYYTYIRPLLQDTLGFSVTALTIILAVLGILDVLSSILSGRLAAKNGMRRLIPVYILQISCLALFAPLMRSQLGGLTVLLLMGFLIPLFSAPAQVFFLNRANQAHPAAVTLASSLNAIFYNVGIAIASLSAAQTLEHFGLSALGWNAEFYCLLATGCLLLLVRQLKPPAA